MVKYFEEEEINKMDSVILILCDYRIVEKEATMELKYCMESVMNIYDGYEALIDLFDMEEDVVRLCNENIIMHLSRCFDYYSNEYDLSLHTTDWGRENAEFSSEYRIKKTIENNLSEICQKIKSYKI